MSFQELLAWWPEILSDIDNLSFSEAAWDLGWRGEEVNKPDQLLGSSQELVQGCKVYMVLPAPGTGFKVRI